VSQQPIERDPQPESAPLSLIDRLKASGVHRFATLYTVIGWAVMQVSSLVLDAFEAPRWMLKSLLVFIVVGFPVALMLVWALDPARGRVRPSSVGRWRVPSWRLLLATPVAATLLLAGVLVSQGFVKTESASAMALPARDEATISGKSLAILPLASAGADADRGFADGVHEDLLTRLASIRALRVVSASVVARFRDRNDNPRAIARELGVSHVLTGSLRREGKELRLNVRLLDARSDEHVWARTYDRKLSDVLRLQAELAQDIAKELQTVLTPAEQSALQQRDTLSEDAYELYLRARKDPDNTESERLLERAVELDPKFARAWVALGDRRANYYQWDIRRTSDQRRLAREAIDRAASLAPDDPEVLLGVGWFYGQSYRDWDRARREIEKVSDQRPNSAGAAYLLARIATRQGDLERALTLLRRAWQLEPAAEYGWWLGRTLVNLRRYDAARDVYRELHADAKDDPEWALAPAALEWRAEGNAGLLDAFVSKLDESTRQQPALLRELRDLAWEQGDVARFLQRAASVESGGSDDIELQHVYRAMALTSTGQRDASREWLERAATVTEERVRTQPDNAKAWATLGLILALRGDAAERARDAATRAIGLVSYDADFVDAGPLRALYACTLAWLGERELAVAELTRLLGVFYEENTSLIVPLHVRHLRAGVAWRPLQGFAPFEALLADAKSSAPL
jgi:TolB-like protein/Flp pilus assembly protein TadD